MGFGDKKNQLYLIDFGRADRFRDPVTLKHVSGPLNDNRYYTDFATGNMIRGISNFLLHSFNLILIAMSRRDNMESLGYIAVYLAKGRAPSLEQRTLVRYQPSIIQEICRYGFLILKM